MNLKHQSSQKIRNNDSIHIHYLSNLKFLSNSDVNPITIVVHNNTAKTTNANNLAHNAVSALSAYEYQTIVLFVNVQR